MGTKSVMVMLVVIATLLVVKDKLASISLISDDITTVDSNEDEYRKLDEYNRPESEEGCNMVESIMSDAVSADSNTVMEGVILSNISVDPTCTEDGLVEIPAIVDEYSGSTDEYSEPPSE